MTGLFFDGGMGTSLLEKRLSGDPVLLNLSAGEKVADVHKQFVVVGAQVITANTFGAYTHKYENAADIIAAAMAHAKAANPEKVALDIGPLGKMIEPYGDMTQDEARDIFSLATQEGAKHGADLILIETFYCIVELEAAVQAALATKLPVFATMTFDNRGRTTMGKSIEDMVTLLEGLGVSAVGMNCGLGPDMYKTFLPPLLTATKLPVLVQPNAGLPEMVGDKPIYTLSPQDFAQTMAQMYAMGATHLGGCCGTTPQHIAAMVEACGKQ